MNDNNELQTLADRVAALERLDSRREAEHKKLLEVYTELSTSRDDLRRDVDKDFELAKAYFDQRIKKLAARHGPESGDGGPELFIEFARDVAQFVRDYVSAAQTAQLDRVLRLFESQQRFNDVVASVLHIDPHGDLPAVHLRQ